MGQFRLIREKISERFEDLSKSLVKLTRNWNDFTEKITNWGKSMGQRFTDFSDKIDALTLKLQPVRQIMIEVEEDLEIKQLIQGEMDFHDVDGLSKTLWENHEIAQQAFQDTHDLQYYEMAMEILVVIKELEQLKDYLKKHGKT